MVGIRFYQVGFSIDVWAAEKIITGIVFYFPNGIRQNKRGKYSIWRLLLHMWYEKGWSK